MTKRKGPLGPTKRRVQEKRNVPVLAKQRVANVKRIAARKFHADLDPETGRPKR